MVGDHPDDPAPVPASASSDVAAPGVPGGDGALELGYTVTVDNFSGPLDLLLYLVRRTELDILEVPLSLIVDQFVDTVRSWQDADLDVAGEFILMAATLLELKARTIAPPLEQPVEGAEDEPAFDPRESLLKSLLAYRRFKEAAQVIHELGESRWPLVDRQFREHVPEEPVEDTDIDLGEIDLSLLATTCERILSRIGGLGPRTVVVDEMPLGVRIATLLDELSARERATIQELLTGNTSRVVHITTVMATLELARQRFVEVRQPEQFGDIELRLRSNEERERTPELPPAEPEGPKRRRGKLPLMTWHAPAGVTEQTSEETTDDAPEEVVESDEQRFLRELEEATRVTAVLALTADVEKSFTEHWYTLHPELKPAPVIVPPPEAAQVPVFKRAPPKRRVPSETPAAEVAAPAAATPEAVAAAQPAPAPEAAPTTPATETSVPVEAVAASPATEPAPAPAAEVIVATVTETPVLPAAEAVPVVPAQAVETPAAPVEAPIVAATVEEATAPAVADAQPASVVAVAPEPVPEPAAPVAEVVAASAPAEPEAVAPPAPEPQAVLPVEQWPVLHAQPVPEEAPHPLDTIASDDPAAVNALLGEQPRRPSPIADEVEEDDEDEDPDDLLADDPALVNAALQADKPRPTVERRPASDVIIPAPTETTVWTAPVDRGQTASEVDDEVVADSREQAVGDQQPAASSQQPASAGEATPSTEPLRLADDEAPTEPAAVAADDDLEPDDQVLPTDPALIEAAQHAAAPRTVELHPVHDLTIPTATETTVWTAPVDRGQTAALVDEDEDETEETSMVVPSVTTLKASAEVVAPVTVEPAPPVTSAPLPLTTPLSDPTPTTAPLVLSTPVEAPVPVVPAVVAAPTEAAEPEPVVRVPDPPPPESPPPVSPPPPTRPARSDSPADSPNIAPTTIPTKPSPMSPPPRSKIWPLIALFLAINAIWAGVLWFTLLPRYVLEVAATERGGTPEQETLTWRFNLDVVDAVAQAKPPEVVPVITPAIPGRWHWTDARTLVFDAASKLPLATTFTATLPVENFRTVHGFRLRAPGQQTWSTAALSLNDAAVETFTREGTTIALTFNQPVDPLAIAQELSVEVTPVVEPAFAVETTPAPVAASGQPDAGSQEPVAGDQPPVVSDQQLVADAQQPATSSQPAATPVGEPVVAAADAAKPVVTSPTPVAAAPATQVRAITSEASSTIRLLIATPVRGTAKLSLPAGTTGIAGPLGLVDGWKHQIALRQTLVLDSAITEVPSHGDVRIDVAVNDTQAPRELLAPVVTVEPAVPVTVSTTDAGVSLVGAFVPGETYRIRAAATWPDEPATSGHVLAAYTAASEVAVTIPTRPAGIWPGGTEVVDGQTRFAAHAVERADVLLMNPEDECVASRELVWSGSDASPLLDLDDLTDAQPSATYRLRVRSQGDAPVTNEQTLHIDEVRVRPQALVAALSDWLLAGLAGEEHADVRVRVVRLADH